MNRKQMKLEDPQRIKELNPLGTLQRIGIGGNHVVCDVGAGSGIFTIPAATLTSNTVFALEVDKAMLNLIEEKAQQNALTNIRLIEVRDDRYDIDNDSVDIVLLVTVLHEIDNKAAMLGEIHRVLKDEGKFAVIEFHKGETPKGPPTHLRLDKTEVEAIAGKNGFAKIDSFDLEENMYCLVFKKN